MNLQEANNLVHEHRRPQVESSAFAQPDDAQLSSSWQALYFTHESDASTTVGSQLLVSVPRDQEHFIAAPEQVIAYALSQASRWPGLVFWREGATTTFVPCTPAEVKAALTINPLNPIFPLTSLQPSAESFISGNDVLIVHLSDLHVGSGHAGDRCVQLLRMVKQLRASRPEGSLICVVSGDLVDSPNELSMHTATDFIDLLEHVSGSQTIVVPGNHDVRTLGLWGDHQQFPTMASSVTPLVRQGVCFVALDSVREQASLARGKLGQAQLDDVGAELIARASELKGLLRIAVLHHHPRSVQRPAWLESEWYERFFPGRTFEATDLLEDAGAFNDWCDNYGIDLVLHGHKHIPHVHMSNRPMVIGAGSSTGKMRPSDSANILTCINLIRVERLRREVCVEMRLAISQDAGIRREEAVNFGVWRY